MTFTLFLCPLTLESPWIWMVWKGGMVTDLVVLIMPVMLETLNPDSVSFKDCTFY